MLIKGAGGYFPDFQTYEFVPTTEIVRLRDGAYNYFDNPLYRCIGKGTRLNFYEVCQRHPELYTKSNDGNPVELFKGFYLVYTEDYTHLSPGYYRFHFTMNATVENPASGGTATLDTVVLDCYTDLADVFGWGLAIGHTDALALEDNDHNWNIYQTEKPSFFLLFNNTLNSDTWGSDRQLVNNACYTVDEEDVQARKDVVQVNVSSDSKYTWYAITQSRLTAPGDPSFPISSTIKRWVGIEYGDDQEEDTSGPGGGGGNYGYEDSDTNHYDGIPAVTPASSGFINVYHASVSNLLDIAKFMYTDAFLQNVPKLVSNPIDYIISLMLCAAAPDDGTAESLRIGSVKNIAIQIAPVQSVYKTFDCGTVNVEECFGGFLDYAPFTKVRMQLPFCGDIDLDPQIVMHSSVHLRYVVDFLTGSCLARVDVTNNHGIAAETYFKDGNCSVSVPMTGADFNSYYSSLFNAGFSAVSAGVTALATGNPLALMGAVGGGNTQRPHAETTVTGHLGSNHGFLGNYTPSLIISRPVQSFPEGYNPNKGRPSNIGGTLGSFSGYTSVTSIKLDGVVATDAELSEIRQLLAGGVYV